MTAKCKICKNEYSAISNLNKHIRNKHPDVSVVRKQLFYTCNYCNATFKIKRSLLKHIINHVSKRSTNIKCSFENCNNQFQSMKSLTNHLKIDHNENIKVEHMNFASMEEFYKWKKNIEDKENCQYVRNTSMKPGNKVQYIYFDCHRSYNPRLKSKGKRKSKLSVKIGKVCPSRIRIHKKENNLTVQFYSTHLWHDNKIVKLQTLCRKSRSKLPGKPPTNVPVPLHNRKQRLLAVEQIIASHNESKNIPSNMIKQIEDYWIISSHADLNVHKVEKMISSCNGCVLHCELCKICIHTYRCTCESNTLLLNICEHIHACARENQSPLQLNSFILSTIPVLYENEFAVDNQLDDNFVFKNDSSDVEINMLSQIENKLEMILKMMPNSINLSEDGQKYILKYCDNILSILNTNEDACTNNTIISHHENIVPKIHVKHWSTLLDLSQ